MNDETVNRGVFITCLILTIACILGACHARADERREHREHHAHHNYELERQQSYMVQGPVQQRMLIGKTQIDGYRQRDGSTVWYRGNNVVGITQH